MFRRLFYSDRNYLDRQLEEVVVEQPTRRYKTQYKLDQEVDLLDDIAKFVQVLLYLDPGLIVNKRSRSRTPPGRCVSPRKPSISPQHNIRYNLINPVQREPSKSHEKKLEIPQICVIPREENDRQNFVQQKTREIDGILNSQGFRFTHA